MKVPRTEYDTELEEGPRMDVLPLELDDGTRITCTSIAGGQRSTDGVPDFLYLQIGESGADGTLTERYVSSRSLGLGLAPDDLDHVRGLLILALMEHDTGISSMSDERRAALIRVRNRIEQILGPLAADERPPPPRSLIERAREVLGREIERIVGDQSREIGVDGRRSDGEIMALALYVQAHETERASSPGRAFMQSMAAGAGGLLGQIAVRRERHDDTEPPERSTKRAPRRKGKPQPKRKR